MLLSQSCQAKLGVTKNMREGTTILEDYGEELEVVRQAGTGLFMMRIDHLLTEDYIGGDPRLEVLVIDYDNYDSDPENNYNFDRDVSPALVGYPASSSRHTKEQDEEDVVRDHQDERNINVSCGTHHFELMQAATRNKEEFRTFVGLTKGMGPDKDKKAHADLGDPGVKE